MSFIYTSTKLSRVIYPLRHLYHSCVKPDFVKTNYYRLFLSIITYELVLWGNMIKLNDNILIFQDKAIGIISLSHNLDLGKPIFIYNLIIQTSVNPLLLDTYFWNPILVFPVSNKHTRYDTINENTAIILIVSID